MDFLDKWYMIPIFLVIAWQTSIFVKNFLFDHSKKEKKTLQQANLPASSKGIVYAKLYVLLKNYLNLCKSDCEKGGGTNTSQYYDSARQYCLDNSAEISQEVGERALSILDKIQENHHSHNLKGLITQKSYLRELKNQMKRES